MTVPNLAKTASRMAVLVKAPDRVKRVCADIAKHFREKVAPNGFKGMVVTFDQECCILYKAALDEVMPPEESEVVISATGKDERFKPYDRSRDEEERLLDRFRDPNDPLQLLIVTAKLLTGFDAPIGPCGTTPRGPEHQTTNRPGRPEAVVGAALSGPAASPSPVPRPDGTCRLPAPRPRPEAAMQDPFDPAAMTPEERDQEVAAILATGYLRWKQVAWRLKANEQGDLSGRPGDADDSPGGALWCILVPCPPPRRPFARA